MNQKGLPLRSFLAESGQTQVLILAGIVLLLAVAGGVFYWGRLTAPKPQPQTPVTTSSPQPSPTPTDASREPNGSAKTADWKTYIRKNVFEIKYPPNWQLSVEGENDSVISFYREGVADPNKGGQGLCCGLTLYLRGPASVTAESQSRPTERITIAEYNAIRWTDNPPYLDDIWILTPDVTIRATISTINEKPEYQKTDFDTAHKILSTFRLLEQTPVEITWDDAVKLVNSCQVVKVSQYHSLYVDFTLKDGSLKTAKTPKLDIIFSIVSRASETCGFYIQQSIE